jgi:hypothetical protein
LNAEDFRLSDSVMLEATLELDGQMLRLKIGAESSSASRPKLSGGSNVCQKTGDPTYGHCEQFAACHFPTLKGYPIEGILP